MVEAVDSHVGGAHRARQQAVGFDVKLVDQCIARLLVVRVVRRAFDLHVLPQRAPADYVQDLDAAADAEHWKTIVQSPFREAKLDLIELWVDAEVAVVSRGRSIATRLNICAAGE